MAQADLSDAGIDRVTDILFGGPRLADAQRQIHALLIPSSYEQDRVNLAKAQTAFNLLPGQLPFVQNEQPLTVSLAALERHRDEMHRIVAHYEGLQEREERGEQGLNVWVGYELIVRLATGARSGCNELIAVQRERLAGAFRPLGWTRAGEGA